MITSNGHRLFKPKKERPTVNQRQRKLLVKLVEARSQKKKDEVNAKCQHELDLVDKTSREDAGITQTEQEINKIIKAINKKLKDCRDLEEANSAICYQSHFLKPIDEYKIHHWDHDKSPKHDNQVSDLFKLRDKQIGEIEEAEHATILAIDLAGSETKIKTVLADLDLSLDSNLNKAISALL